MSWDNADSSTDGALPKRRKTINRTDDKNKDRRQRATRIFAPFRTIGLISSTAVPFTSISLGKTTFQITTSVGRCLQTYDLRNGLNLVFLTRPQTPAIITSSFAWKDRVFAAWGGEMAGSKVGIWVFKRGKKIDELEMPHGTSEPIKQILIFGSWIVGCCTNRVEVWKSATLEHYTTLTPAGSENMATGGILSGGVANMPTFLNKILIGKQDGSVEIWNVSTGRLVYTILPLTASGPVTAIQPTPALSIIAIARGDGSIDVHDIRADKAIFMLNTKSSHSSAITSISFRTDGLGAGDDGRKAGIMATAGTDDGDVTFWDLSRDGRVIGVLRGAHNPPSPHLGGVSGGINKVEFLAGQDVMISSGLDNALKSWIFDATSLTAVPRILHSRSGHAAPLTQLSFLPSNGDGSDARGKWLLSAGRDQSLWGWSLRRDGQSTELSQGNIRKKAKKLGVLGKSLDLDNSPTLEDLKAPEITCIACSLNRDGGMGAFNGGGGVWTNITSKVGPDTASESSVTGWESVVTGHRGDKYARTWFWGRKKAGRWAFETADGTEVTSVAITTCGNFALVGSAGGSISMFNLQSGILRQRFPSTLTPGQAKKLKTIQVDENRYSGAKAFALGEAKHTKAVSGLTVDSLNRIVISCGLDGKIKFWNFRTGCLLDVISWQFMTAIIASQYYRPSDLIAFSCDDLAIRVVDTETKKLVRELWGCSGQISTFCFSNDGRWIIAASMDSTVKVWDLPTGHLINALHMQSPCTALAFSDTGEYLATAHADSVGINIWNNRTLFAHVPTRLIHEDEIIDAIEPTASGETGQTIVAAAFSDGEDEDDEDTDVLPSNALPSTIDRISADLLSLSIVPKSRWQTLLHLDTIKQRNKPKEPPKVPEKAPFFLPSTLTPLPASSSLDLQSVDSVAPSALNSSRISKLQAFNSNTNPFTTLLHASIKSGLYDAFIDHLSTLSPSSADIEIRSLSPSSPQPTSELTLFVHALTYRLRQKRDYELVQAWMAVFLKAHGESVVLDSGTKGGLRDALETWKTVQSELAGEFGRRVAYCKGVVGWLRSER